MFVLWFSWSYICSLSIALVLVKKQCYYLCSSFSQVSPVGFFYGTILFILVIYLTSPSYHHFLLKSNIDTVFGYNTSITHDCSLASEYKHDGSAISVFC